jgi:hypothetical protein
MSMLLAGLHSYMSMAYLLKVHLHASPISNQLVPFYRRKKNCIENKTNAKSASEIGFVNKPLIALLDVWLACTLRCL